MSVNDLEMCPASMDVGREKRGETLFPDPYSPKVDRHNNSLFE